MSDQPPIDLTTLQFAIIDTAADHPNYTYDEIATECDCATSTVGRTLREMQLPDKDRPPLTAISSLDEHERLRWHATMDALAQVGSLIRSAEQRETKARMARNNIDRKQEQVQEEIAGALSTEVIPPQSVETIREIVERRLRHYPTEDLLEDISDIATAKGLFKPGTLEALSDILMELSERCAALMETDRGPPAQKHQYKDAADSYADFGQRLRAEVEQQKGRIVDPVPRAQLVAEVEEIRHERIVETAQAIHDAIAADTSVEPIVEEYQKLSRQVTPSELVGHRGLGEPLYPPYSKSNLTRVRDELIAAPEFRHS